MQEKAFSFDERIHVEKAQQKSDHSIRLGASKFVKVVENFVIEEKSVNGSIVEEFRK